MDHPHHLVEELEAGEKPPDEQLPRVEGRLRLRADHGEQIADVAVRKLEADLDLVGGGCKGGSKTRTRETGTGCGWRTSIRETCGTERVDRRGTMTPAVPVAIL